VVNPASFRRALKRVEDSLSDRVAEYVHDEQAAVASRLATAKATNPFSLFFPSPRSVWPRRDFFTAQLRSSFFEFVALRNDDRRLRLLSSGSVLDR
jgi:hypothetical protein